jgi:hypothetical protein
MFFETELSHAPQHHNENLQLDIDLVNVEETKPKSGNNALPIAVVDPPLSPLRNSKLISRLQLLSNNNTGGSGATSNSEE